MIFDFDLDGEIEYDAVTVDPNEGDADPLPDRPVSAWDTANVLPPDTHQIVSLRTYERDAKADPWPKAP